MRDSEFLAPAYRLLPDWRFIDHTNVNDNMTKAQLRKQLDEMGVSGSTPTERLAQKVTKCRTAIAEESIISKWQDKIFVNGMTLTASNRVPA